MKIEFKISFKDADNNENIELEISESMVSDDDGSCTVISLVNKGHGNENYNSFEFTIDNRILSKLVDVLLLRLSQNDN